MTETAVATPDMPEEQHDPEALLKLKNAHDVLQKELLNTEAEAKKAYADTWEKAALTHARFRAIVYELLADCHAAGFSTSDVNRVLGAKAAL